MKVNINWIYKIVGHCGEEYQEQQHVIMIGNLLENYRCVWNVPLQRKGRKTQIKSRKEEARLQEKECI
jgi:hypothetical protein